MNTRTVVRKTYISDRGQEFELSQMANSHILNVIAHHHRQLYVLNLEKTNRQGTPMEAHMQNIDRMIRELHQTVDDLFNELAGRGEDYQQSATARGSLRR